MVRRKSEIQWEEKPSPFGGTGRIKVRNLLEGANEMYEKGRVFAHTTVYPGSGIGIHRHENESETYYIVSGSGIYHDNGVNLEIHPGDVCFCGDHQVHGIEAVGEPIEMIALILYHNC